MYHAFVNEGRSERDIAAALNLRGLRTDLDRPWNRGTVHQVLINEKYAGNNVWNRVSCKLKGRRIQNAPAMWVRADGAFERSDESRVGKEWVRTFRSRGWPYI